MAVRKSPTLAEELTRKIVAKGRDVGRFVRIDMEDSTLTSRTLGIYRRLRRDGFDNTGVVLQSCLRRTFDDARKLAEIKADVRLVKGIYIEPEKISYRDPEAIRRNWVRILRLLLSKGCRVAAATHDDLLLYETEAAMGDLGMKTGDLEIQMLLGVRVPLLTTLLAAGHRVRVYVPFGEEWYAYGVRRLKENPAIAGHVTKAFFGRLFGRGG
jgi:proline dehydrogenase